MPYYELPELGETVPMRMIHIKYFCSTGTSAPPDSDEMLGRSRLGMAVEQHAAQVFARGTRCPVIERPKRRSHQNPGVN